MFHGNQFSVCDQEAVSDSLIVVSYNIEKGEKIDKALDLIRGHSILNSSHIFLLQEMDEHGTKRMADSLKMNYVYFPINRDPNTGKSFGNSILSKDTILMQQKLVLPHGQTHNNRMRGASIALTYHNGMPIRLYSVHMATVVMPTSKRLDQVDSLTSHISQFVTWEDPCIIGGDFNSVTSAFRNKVVSKFDNINFTYATKGLGATQKGPIRFLKPELDMIFSKNFEVIKRGKVVDNTASDHFPIWTQLKVRSNNQLYY
jgi:endonuclease/exonuclease/phosphatase family metal-dependent hydrolase